MTDTLSSDLEHDEILAHYGVKGMKWGTVRARAASGDRKAVRQLEKADKKWQESSKGTKAYIGVHNKAAQKMNDGLTAKFNANPKYKTIKDFSDFNDPKVKAYHSDYGKLFDRVFAETIKETYGESPSGRYRAEVRKDSNGNYYAEMVDTQALQQADEEPLRFELTKDSAGRITGVGDRIIGSLEHSFEEMSDEELEHAGVKGMKWGVRKDRNPNYSDQQVRRDRQVYGRRGSNRINKAMNQGDSISLARGAEKTRRDRVMGKNKYARQGGKVAGAIGAVVLSNVGLTAVARSATSRVGQNVIRRVMGPYSDVATQSIAFLASNPISRVAISAGAAKVGSMLAGDAAVAINMRANGYDPSRR